jgi:transposase
MNLLDELARTDIAPALLTQVRALFAQQQAKLAENDFKIKALTFELAYYKRVRFGKASEALVGEQRLLFDETVDMDLAAIDEELHSQASSKPPRKRAGRQPLPPELPRIEHRHEPESCQCGQCGAALVKIGEDVNEQLDVEPARFFVHRHIRPQYACRPCETVTAAPIPAAVIDGGMAAVGLLAWIAACKYLDHLPLYRIEQIAARQGIPLARSTLADWIGRIGVAPCSRWRTGWPNCCGNTTACMPMKRRCANSILAAAKRVTPTSGPIVPACMTTVRRSSCLTTRPAAPAPMRARSCTDGAAT